MAAVVLKRQNRRKAKHSDIIGNNLYFGTFRTAFEAKKKNARTPRQNDSTFFKLNQRESKENRVAKIHIFLPTHPPPPVKLTPDKSPQKHRGRRQGR